MTETEEVDEYLRSGMRGCRGVDMLLGRKIRQRRREELVRKRGRAGGWGPELQGGRKVKKKKVSKNEGETEGIMLARREREKKKRAKQHES